MVNNLYSTYENAINEQLLYLTTKGLQDLSDERSSLSDNATDCIPFRFPTFEKVGVDNEYMIKCPYAGATVNVQVMFNIHEPWTSPDFTVNDAEFMEKISLENLANEVPCLNSWNYKSKDVIQRFLHQLTLLYKKHQLKMLEMEELLFYEYTTLLSTLEITEKDIELSISGGGTYLASILIKLPIDIEEIPPVLLCGNPGPSYTQLLINIKKNSGAIIPKIFISPQIENILGGSSKGLLPLAPAGSSLSDYAANVVNTVRSKIKATLNKFEARKQIVAELLCNFGNSLIEYDAQLFTKASFLIGMAEYYVVVTIYLSEKAGERSSRLVFRSVYCQDSKGPVTKHIKDVSWEGKSPQDTVAIIKVALKKQIPIFKNHCNDKYE